MLFEAFFEHDDKTTPADSWRLLHKFFLWEILEREAAATVTSNGYIHF